MKFTIYMEIPVVLYEDKFEPGFDDLPPLYTASFDETQVIDAVQDWIDANQAEISDRFGALHKDRNDYTKADHQIAMEKWYAKH
jgi:hypothetical protein